MELAQAGDPRHRDFEPGQGIDAPFRIGRIHGPDSVHNDAIFQRLGPFERYGVGKDEDPLPVAFIRMQIGEALVGESRGDGSVGTENRKHEIALHRLGRLGHLHSGELEVEGQGFDDPACGLVLIGSGFSLGLYREDRDACGQREG